VATELQRNKINLVTTHAVLLEIGAALSKLPFRANAARLMHSLMNDPGVQIVALDDTLVRKALDMFEQRTDKEWSLCDCTSFAVMQQHGIIQALSTDRHFDQAGFMALMLLDGLVH
jgi:uncharacterized protein